MRFKAVIFDLDGTLIDSEQHWVAANQIFLDKYKIMQLREHGIRMHGRSMRESVTMLKEEHQLEASVEQLIADKTAASDSIYTTMSQPIPGADELLVRLYKNKTRMAIASGSTLPRIELIVKRFGWQPYFELLASVDEVDHRGKPDPAVFTFTLEKMKLAADDCIIVEDSVNGLKAAKDAGVKCIALTKQGWSEDGDYSSADLRIPSLQDPKLYSYLGL